MTRKNNKIKIYKPKKSYTLKLKRSKKLVKFEKQLNYIMKKDKLKKIRLILEEDQDWRDMYKLQMHTLKKAERLGIRYEEVKDD